MLQPPRTAVTCASSAARGCRLVALVRDPGERLRIPGRPFRVLAEGWVDEGCHEGGCGLRGEGLGRWDAFRGRWVGAGPFGGDVEVLEWPDVAEVSLGGDGCPKLVEVSGLGVGDQD